MSSPASTSTVVPRVTLAELGLLFQAGPQGLVLPPIAATTIRGAIGAALRKVSCVTGMPDCAACALRSACPYGRVWEPVVDDAGKRVEPPPPYVVDAPMGPEPHVLADGDLFTVTLRLFGIARAFVPQLVLAARRAAEVGFGPPDARRPAILLQADHAWSADERTPIWDLGTDLAAVPAEACAVVEPEWSERVFDRVRVILETPLALVRSEGDSKRMILRPSAADLTRKVAGRLEQLARYHEAAPLPTWRPAAAVSRASGVELVDSTLEHVAEERFSNRQGGKVPIAGVVGELVFEDVPEGLVNLWACASYVNVGKNTMIGFGRIAVEVR